MSLLIQNMACFEVNLDPNSHRFYFNEDALKKGAIVENVFLYFSNSGNNQPVFLTHNPFSLSLSDNNNLLTKASLLDNDGLYLNLSDNKSEFVSNLFFKNINAFKVSVGNLLKLNLNRKIDVSKCYFNYSTNVPIRFLCYITYLTKPVKTNIESPIIGSFGVNIKLDPTKTFQDIKLSDIIPVQKKNLKIRKISFSGIHAYLYLISKDNLIENIPSVFFQNRNQNSEILFDDINIDFEQSYFKFRNSIVANLQHSLTFYY